MWSTLFIFFGFAVVVSFVCSLLEATILSTNSAFIESLVTEGKPAGRRLRRLKRQVDRPLIAILTLNTVANMFGAAGVGNEAGKLARRAGVGESEQLWVTLASAVLTLTILIGSEIVPKTLGARYWRSIAAPLSPLLVVLVVLFYPLIPVLEIVPRLIAGRGAGEAMTREDLAATTELVRLHGDIPDRQAEAITNLITMSAQQLKTVLTPRVEMFTLQADETVGAVVRAHPTIRFSRIPVYDEPDRFIGVVLRSRIHEAALRGRGETVVRELVMGVRYVPETKTLASMLDDFLDNDEQLALVVDEHGSVEGLVSMEDVIETMLGAEIMDELDTVADLQALALARAHARSRGGGRRRRSPGRA
jgi:CBS domain containing-hemolysin-like protein